MGIQTKHQNSERPPPGVEEIAVEPQALIDALLAKVQQLTAELVMRDAVIATLRAGRGQEEAGGLSDSQ